MALRVLAEYNSQCDFLWLSS